MYSNLMTTPNEGRSDIYDREAHAKSGQHLIESETYKFWAKASTLNSLLIETQAPQQIDLLSLDVEGGEMEVFNGIDHDHFRFSVKCIESRSFGKLEEFLNMKRYKFEKKLTKHDYLFLDESKSRGIRTK